MDPNHLGETILSGTTSGGARIGIPDVAGKLGMSRMPVREALWQLDAEGLVTIRPNRGAVVTPLTPSDVLEIFEMRAVLEGLAVRVARPRLDEEAFEDLGLLVERTTTSAGGTVAPGSWRKPRSSGAPGTRRRPSGRCASTSSRRRPSSWRCSSGD